MRIALWICLVLAPAAALAGEPPAPPPSAAILLRLHPGVWTPPASVPAVRRAVRFDPDGGEAPPASPASGAATITRAQAEASVRVAADGSLHSVVGGALRRWTVASVGADGRLRQECVHGRSAAIARIRAAADGEGR